MVYVLNNGKATTRKNTKEEIRRKEEAKKARMKRVNRANANGYIDTDGTDNEFDSMVVISTQVARKLIHEGFHLIDIKANKYDSARTVFVFERTNEIQDRFNEIVSENKSQF